MVLKGAAVSRSIMERLAVKSQELREKRVFPKLAIVRAGERPDDLSYEKSVLKKADSIGIRVQVFTLAENCGTEEVAMLLRLINEDQNIHGTLLFSPMPKTVNEEIVRRALIPEKDVDGITPQSGYGVFSGRRIGFPPCTPEACVRMMDYYGIEPDGKQITIVGRSMVVGRPLAMMLLQRNATVTICHTHTKDLKERCLEADIVIAAAGVPKLLNGEYFREGQVVLDVGIHPDGENGFCGDVNYEEASAICADITPVPGGVGNVTTAVLLEHVLEAAEQQNKWRDLEE
ncbi:MAG: bifunctional 5,10-methylenetetrahydrofolate dehydrogenase/5,10-methenyltetrahydrofolate cyclohydrolase [Lachnospiraceae bacterium]|nr:bifunctional 5,10-methylenetetrahydrofolate dehydrogenase/5,10-methenyltetrahydrofolate cyclohydrolase [Lachnospiraceae bacterium]